MKQISRDNNFDLIRLIAAMLVVLAHSVEHLKIDGGENLNLFPGVMIFFAISGYLIFATFDRNKSIKRYAINRFLRIFPALWVCFIMTLILLFSFGVVNFESFFSRDVLAWSVAQLTFFQFWTPDVLRGWGVGTPNGSLWTIPVELQFYMIVPIVTICFKRLNTNCKLTALLLLSILFNMYYADDIIQSSKITYKLINVSLFTYLYCFLVGSLLYVNWSLVRRFIEGKVIWWAVAYMSMCLLFDIRPSYYIQDIRSCSANIVLCILTISAAYSCRSVGKILCRNDISYGVYIYHMLVINSFVALGWIGHGYYLLFAIVITVFLGILSWVFIEKRALSLKNGFKI